MPRSRATIVAAIAFTFLAAGKANASFISVISVSVSPPGSGRVDDGLGFITDTTGEIEFSAEIIYEAHLHAGGGALLRDPTFNISGPSEVEEGGVISFIADYTPGAISRFSHWETAADGPRVHFSSDLFDPNLSVLVEPIFEEILDPDGQLIGVRPVEQSAFATAHFVSEELFGWDPFSTEWFVEHSRTGRTFFGIGPDFRFAADDLGAKAGDLLYVSAYSHDELFGPLEASQTVRVTGSVEEVPEPSTFALLGMGSLGMIGFGWRRKRKTKLAA